MREPSLDASVEPSVVVTGLCKSYRSTSALTGVTLSVRAGEIFAVLGPNGAGKTTLIEILEGFRRPDAGSVRVLGTDPFRAGPAWRARIGAVLQSAGEFEDLTVGEVLRHFAGYYPHPHDPQELLTRVGLDARARDRVRALSGGQRRRLDVAVGVLGRPEVLFLDEPTTGFDPQARRELWGLVRELARDGSTVILTTHYLDEAEALADRVAVLAGGRLLQVAPPAEVGRDDEGSARVSWIGCHGVQQGAQTDRPTAFVHELGERFGGEVPGLSVSWPTLEERYLSMIGADPS